MEAAELRAALRGFIGTVEYHPHWSGMKLTDGVHFLAEEAEAYWLLDVIASWQPKALRDPALREFQLWELFVRTDRTATIVCSRDSEDVAFRQHIEEHGRIGCRAGNLGEVCHRAVQIERMAHEIDPEADDDRVLDSFEQDTRQLGAVDQKVVRPFDRDLMAGREGGDDLVQGDGGDDHAASGHGERRQPRRTGEELTRPTLHVGGDEQKLGAALIVEGGQALRPQARAPVEAVAVRAGLLDDVERQWDNISSWVNDV